MISDLRLHEGSAAFLGAAADRAGVNFALFSAHAEKVELCLFDGDRERVRLPLPARTGDIWHGYLAGGRLGLRYGYRVYGPYAPEQGHRFNHHKLLIDPCARALSAGFMWSDLHCGYTVGDPRGDLSFDTRDNAVTMPKAIVVDGSVAASACVQSASDMIYELHVRGMTMQHENIRAELRGTLAGLIQPEILRHLHGLGVGTVELMPVTPAATSRRLATAGLRNYWGYNPINFFAVEPRLLASGWPNEFRRAVDAFHDHGIAVILDMVFNHSGEEGADGPTVSLRGIDNASYYRLADDKRFYVDWTGCHNTLNTSHPEIRRMVMECLRYWAEHMGVDGFRLDLAVTLGRNERGFSADDELLAEMTRDPVIGKLKLIAEPWDMGPDGYKLGRFGAPWSEWNDKFRDDVRNFWRGARNVRGNLATRLSGSQDLFPRRPAASINFITAHDGFTLEDLVSYEHKRNDANLENGADGTPNNLSWNCGVEGTTSDPNVLDLRTRQKRNMLATLLLAAGTPMLRGGDELGHTQAGNNNAYCQDNEISWIDWARTDTKLVEFVSRLMQLRQRYPALCGTDAEAQWFSARGQEMSIPDWYAVDVQTLGVLRIVHQRSFLLLFNGGATLTAFILPHSSETRWNLWIYTAPLPERLRYVAGEEFSLAPHSFALFSDAEEAVESL